MLYWHKLFNYYNPSSAADYVQVENQIYQLVTNSKKIDVLKLDFGAEKWISVKYDNADIINHKQGIEFLAYYVQNHYVYTIQQCDGNIIRLLEYDTKSSSWKCLFDLNLPNAHSFAFFQNELYIGDRNLVQCYSLATGRSKTVIGGGYDDIRFVEFDNELCFLLYYSLWQRLEFSKISDGTVNEVFVKDGVDMGIQLSGAWPHKDCIYYTTKKNDIVNLYCIDMTTFDVSDIDMIRMYSTPRFENIFIIDEKLHKISNFENGESILYISSNVPSLFDITVQQITDKYTTRVQNGENIAVLLSDIDKLSVPANIKKLIHDNTDKELHKVRRKLRRAARREALQRNNDPNLRDKDEEVIDKMPITDKEDKGPLDPSWILSYPLNIMHDTFQSIETVNIGSKIWMFATPEHSVTTQIFCFHTESGNWKREFFKHEEKFLGLTNTEKFELMEELRIPSYRLTMCGTPVENCVYGWQQNANEEDIAVYELYMFDTVNREWKYQDEIILDDHYIWDSTIYNGKMFISHVGHHSNKRSISVYDLTEKTLLNIFEDFEHEVAEYNNSCDFFNINGTLYLICNVHDYSHIYQYLPDQKTFKFVKNADKTEKLRNVEWSRGGTIMNTTAVQFIYQPRLCNLIVLEELDLETLEWQRTWINGKLPFLSSMKGFMIKDKIFVITGGDHCIKVEARILDMNPSQNTNKILKLTDDVITNHGEVDKEMDGMTDIMRWKFNNILEWKKSQKKDLSGYFEVQVDWDSKEEKEMVDYDSEMDEIISAWKYED